MFKKLYIFLVVLVGVSYANAANKITVSNASKLKGVSVETYTVQGGTTFDVLNIQNPDNQSFDGLRQNVSFNDLEAFEIDQAGVYINNEIVNKANFVQGNTIYGKLSNYADTIVINVSLPSITNINGAVNILGNQANLVVQNLNGTINCNACSFGNIRNLDLKSNNVYINNLNMQNTINSFRANADSIILNNSSINSNYLVLVSRANTYLDNNTIKVFNDIKILSNKDVSINGLKKAGIFYTPNLTINNKGLLNFTMSDLTVNNLNIISDVANINNVNITADVLNINSYKDINLLSSNLSSRYGFTFVAENKFYSNMSNFTPIEPSSINITAKNVGFISKDLSLFNGSITADILNIEDLGNVYLNDVMLDISDRALLTAKDINITSRNLFLTKDSVSNILNYKLISLTINANNLTITDSAELVLNNVGFNVVNNINLVANNNLTVKLNNQATNNYMPNLKIESKEGSVWFYPAFIATEKNFAINFNNLNIASKQNIHISNINLKVNHMKLLSGNTINFLDHEDYRYASRIESQKGFDFVAKESFYAYNTKFILPNPVLGKPINEEINITAKNIKIRNISQQSQNNTFLKGSMNADSVVIEDAGSLTLRNVFFNVLNSVHLESANDLDVRFEKEASDKGYAPNLTLKSTAGNVALGVFSADLREINFKNILIMSKLNTTIGSMYLKADKFDIYSDANIAFISDPNFLFYHEEGGRSIIRAKGYNFTAKNSFEATDTDFGLYSMIVSAKNASFRKTKDNLYFVGTTINAENLTLESYARIGFSDGKLNVANANLISGDIEIYTGFDLILQTLKVKADKFFINSSRGVYIGQRKLNEVLGLKDTSNILDVSTSIFIKAVNDIDLTLNTVQKNPRVYLTLQSTGGKVVIDYNSALAPYKMFHIAAIEAKQGIFSNVAFNENYIHQDGVVLGIYEQNQWFFKYKN